MAPEIHINNGIQGWIAYFEKPGTLHITGRDKNAVVCRAEALAKKWYSKAKLIIHGADGRILEERVITPEEHREP